MKARARAGVRVGQLGPGLRRPPLVGLVKGAVRARALTTALVAAGLLHAARRGPKPRQRLLDGAQELARMAVTLTVTLSLALALTLTLTLTLTLALTPTPTLTLSLT